MSTTPPTRVIPSPRMLFVTNVIFTVVAGLASFIALPWIFLYMPIPILIGVLVTGLFSLNKPLNARAYLFGLVAYVLCLGATWWILATYGTISP